MAFGKKKDKGQEKDEKQIEGLAGEEAKEGLGSKLVLVFVTILIIAIWLGIIVLLIRFDVGGFGSTVLRPLIKDVPYLNMILPEPDEDELGTEYQYETIEDAVDRIKELEGLLDEALAKNALDADTIVELHNQIAELSVYKEEQVAFEKLKEKFYEEVVFSAEGLGYEQYKYFYEEIDPENAEVLYKQVVEQVIYDEEVKDYARTYSSMQPKEAAAIFDTMTGNLRLVADILLNMDVKSRADILGKMDPENAAKLTSIMEPKK